MSSSFSIRPESGVYKLLKHVKYKPWYALAEFVDNSLQSFFSKKYRYIETRPYCRVEINCDPNNKTITIEDNSYGIAESEHQRAFTVGKPPEDKSGLSEFGVGMKAAGIWFSPNWTVTTCSIDSNKVYQYNFRLEKLTGSDVRLVPTITEAIAYRGFTKIELYDLHQSIKGRALGKIRAHLKSIYRCFLRDGSLILMFNGDKLTYEEPKILSTHESGKSLSAKDSKIAEWKKSISFEFANNIKVTGFAAILETGSLKYAGFSLFRRNRLILDSDDERYRPQQIFGQINSFEYQRIFGELYIDEAEVLHTKDDILFGEYEEEFFEKLREAVNSELLSLIRQARGYRSRKATNTVITGFDEVTKKTSKILPDNTRKEHQGKELFSQSSDTDDCSIYEQNGKSLNTPQLENAKRINRKSKMIFVIGAIYFEFQIRYEKHGNSFLYKTEYVDDQSRSASSKKKRLAIIISEEHDLYVSALDASNKEPTNMLLIIITLVITETLLKASGNNYARFISKGFNEQLSFVIKTMRKYKKTSIAPSGAV